MTLKDLANKYHKSTKAISRVLTRLGYKGIYKDDHAIPAEAIPLVEVAIVEDGNTLQSLPSANLNQPEEAPIQQQEATASSDSTALQQLMSASVAIKNEINTHRHNEIKSDYEKVGAMDAITAVSAYHNGFNQTYQVLAELDKKSHQQMMSDLQKELAENLDFFGQQANQSYYNLSNRTTDKTGAKDILTMVKNLKY